MRQINFVYDDIHKALDGLNDVAEQLKGAPPESTLLHIYLSGLSSTQAKILLQDIEGVFPDIAKIGISEFPAYTEHNHCLIKLNFILADTAQFFSCHIECSRGSEKSSAEHFLELIKNIQDIKAIEICSANQLTDASTFVERIGERYPNVAIFGSLSKPAKIVDGNIIQLDDSFSIDRDIRTDGFSVVIYSGKKLNISLNYIQSWQPIGKDMHIRMEENPILGASGIYEIGGNSARKTYNKYLGIPIDDRFTSNAWYFPLIVTRNDINICFTPIGCNNDTVYFSGRMYEYETIRFSYCTREEILDASFYECERIKNFSPQALLLVVCANRYAFMKDDEKSDLQYYKNCVEDLSHCHAYGEIAYKDKKGGVLNSALVSVALNESAQIATTETAFFTTAKPRTFTQSSIPISYIISHFFHQMTLEIVNYQHALEEKVSQISQENENLSLRIVQTLAGTIDAKDRYTNGHSGRVAEYAREIARRYGYGEKELVEVYMIGLLHDVGKIGVPDYVINKRSKLSLDEFELIKKHPIIGAHILNTIKEKPNFATGARCHHERFDGNGYPDGIKGKDIPEIARIITVADAYDAMTSNRSYRKALPQNHVRFEIANGKGRQFDPIFADIMLQMIDGDTEYSMKEKPRESNMSIGRRTIEGGLLSNEITSGGENAHEPEIGQHFTLSLLVDYGKSMPGGFFVYKAGGDEELLYVNDLVLSIFGCSSLDEFRELTNFTFPGMVYKHDLERTEISIYEQVERNDNNLLSVEYRIKRKDGQIRWMDDSGRLVNTIEYGDVFYALIRDITEQHNTREFLTDLDHLTKVYNRRHFDRELAKNVSSILHLGGTLCMIMVDIDFFKKFNDLYGHFAGDKCLIEVAQAMRKALRRNNDLLFRYGGEEFAVLLPGALIRGALAVAEQMRIAVQDLGIAHEHGSCGVVTISAGVAILSGEEAHLLADPAAELIQLADKALYKAKNSGRNCVMQEMRTAEEP